MGESLAIYDPRFQDRSIITDRGIWSSAKEQVLFFETDASALYTNSEFVSEVLHVLLSETNAPKIGMRVSATSSNQAPRWLTANLHGELVGIADATVFSDAVDFFEKEANYGVWDFYGLESAFDDRNALIPFPALLGNADQFHFAVEIDLDSILMGFSQVGSNIDRLINRLQSSAAKVSQLT